ncbi:hypothetical protein BH18ACI4_BH18ACI4_12310 [soil metagenome]
MGQFRLECPTDFSLSGSNDKLIKHVGHQTDHYQILLALAIGADTQYITRTLNSGVLCPVYQYSFQLRRNE